MVESNLNPVPPEAQRPRAATPSAAVVVSRGGSTTLDSIVTQDCETQSRRRRWHAPDLNERVRAVARRTRFAAAANTVLETDIESAFLLVCHDDVALAPDAVRILVTEALRSNAGVAGPKLVPWDEPGRLQHVGLRVDQFAVADDLIDPGERDQEQYDAVTDVFAVPSACVLVRAGLFASIGGFDPGITRRARIVLRAQLAGLVSWWCRTRRCVTERTSLVGPGLTTSDGRERAIRSERCW